MQNGYSKDYYDHYDMGEGGTVSYLESEALRGFMSSTAGQIVETLHPKTALDAGCAMGILVSELRKRGVDAYGIDYSDYAVANADPIARPYCVQGSLADPLPEAIDRRFDLVTCFEVLEHMSVEDGRKAIANLCRLSDTILFCSSPDDFEDPTHINVRPRAYWARCFAENGYFDDLFNRPLFITPYAVCYRKRENWADQIDLYENYIESREKEEGDLVRSNVYMMMESGYGDNYTASFTHQCAVNSGKGLGVSFDVSVKAGCDRVYLEPCEGQPCLVEALLAMWRGETLSPSIVNGCVIGSMIVFPSQPPLFEIRLPDDGGATLHIAMSLRPFKTYDLKLQDIVNGIEAKQRAVALQYQERIEELEEIHQDYEVVIHSTSWRITRPLRALADVSKRFISDDNRALVAAKTIKWSLQHGPKQAKLLKNEYLMEHPYRSFAWPNRAELARQRAMAFPKAIKFSILVPLYNTPKRFLREMIESVLRQSYVNWELCLADGSNEAGADVGRICGEMAQKDGRIKYQKLERNLGISGNTNACIDMATGDYIALLDHDDILHPSALYEMMKVICEKGADFIYTDETTFESPNIKRIGSVHYKPDFMPDNLLANNYICHFTAFSAGLLDVAGRFRPEYDGSQDHDLFLRLTHAAGKVEHIPKVLYWWRAHTQSVAQDIGAKDYAIDAGKRAVRDFLRNCSHIDADVISSEAFPTIFQIVYPIPSRDRVSIIIVNRDQGASLRKCVHSILTKTRYENYEILIMDDGSKDFDSFMLYRQLEHTDRVRVLSNGASVGIPALYNRAVEQCDGKYIVLMHASTEVITPEWLDNMLMYAQRDDTGAVGAKLYMPDGRIQQAGIVFDPKSPDVAMKGHNRVKAGNFGYMGRLFYAQDMSAVSDACLMMRRDRYLEAGGMDEGYTLSYGDLDLCLRLRARGCLNVFTPFAELYCGDPPSPGFDSERDKVAFDRDRSTFKQRWAKVLESGDPCYNPNFSIHSTTFDFVVDP